MKLYDGTSPIEWESGTLTVEEMQDRPELEQLLSEPSVLIDNGDVVVDWMLLSAMCSKYEVAQTGEAESDYDALVKALNTAKEEFDTDPQLQALATLQISTMSFDKTPCDEVVKFVDYWPDWKPDTSYKHNDPLTHQGRKFRASKDLTSQAIYPPGTAESEYYEVTLAPDGIIVWYNVGGDYNMVYKGEKRHYPDAEGPVYEALENTSYSPDAYPQHWKRVDVEA